MWTTNGDAIADESEDWLQQECKGGDAIKLGELGRIKFECVLEEVGHGERREGLEAEGKSDEPEQIVLRHVII